jgi:hypothetical protein
MIKFTVDGEAVPYIRMTQAQVKLMKIPDHKITNTSNIKTKKQLKRYFDWKELVNFHARNLDFSRSPNEDNKLFVTTIFYFKNYKHCDSDNAHKGILDALFDSDKCVTGAHYYFIDKTNPRVEVTIELFADWIKRHSLTKAASVLGSKRMAKMSPEERSEFGKMAARAKKRKKEQRKSLLLKEKAK